MKRKKLVVFIVSICLLAGSMPVSGEPETVDEVPVTEETPVDEGGTAAYPEGRALAVITGTDSGNLLGASGDVVMENIYPLGGGDSPGGLLGAGEKEETSAVYLVQSDTLSTEELLKRLKENPQVETAEPDYYTESASLTDDPYVGRQWSLQQQDQVPGGIQAGSAWAYGTGSQEYVVGVVDSGVDITHPDLADNLWVSPEGTYGYNGADLNSDVTDESENGHGTHVAGIIGASGNNGIGISGVSQKVKVMTLRRESPEHGGSVYTAVRCYNYAREQWQRGTQIVAMNNSWELLGETFSTIMQQVVDSFYEETGAVSVFASGNDSQDVDGRASMVYGGEKSVMNVDAINKQGKLTNFSNRGKRTTDIAAPGEHILSCVPQGMGQADMSKEADPGTILYMEDFEDGGDVFETTPYEGDGTVGITEDPQQINGECLEWNVGFEGPSSLPCLESEPVDMSAYKGAKNFALLGMAGDSSADRDFRTGVYIDLLNADGSIQEGAANAVLPGEWGTATVNIKEPEKIDWEHFVFRVSYTTDTEESSQLPMKIYLDNMGFSNSQQPYQAYDGTSMAAPAVSGSLALLKSLFPEEDMGRIRARVLGGVTRTDELEQSCISGGYLNLEKAIQNPYPVLDTLSQEGDTGTIGGYFFGSSPGVLTLEGQQLEILDWQEEKITFQMPKTIREGEWEFKAARGGSGEEYGSRFFEVMETSRLFEKLPAPDPDTITETLVASDGEWGFSVAYWQNKVYVFTSEIGWKDEKGKTLNFLWCYDIVTGKWEMVKTRVPKSDWNITAAEGKIYFISGYSKAMYSFELASGTTTAIPVKGMEKSERVLCPGIAWDGESFWIIGGSIGENGGALSAEVWKINKNTGNAQKMPDLKFPRTQCTAICSNGKILVAGGMDESMKFQPNTEILDKNQWVTGAAYPDVHSTQGGIVAAGAVQDGILTVGPSQTQGGRNQTVLYHMDTDVWETLDVVPADSPIQMPKGIACKDYFYVFARKAGTPGNYVFLRTPADTPKPAGPAVPQAVKASAGDGTVKLAWGQVPGATGYVVYGYTGKEKSFNTRKAVWGRSITSWTEEKLQPGTQRRYVVRAFKNIDGVNYYSGCSKTAATAVRPKAAVIKSAAAGKGTARITLAGRPAGAVGYAYCTSMDNKTFRIVAKGPKMPYTMKGLKKGTNYIKVRSYVKDINGKTVYGSWSKVWKVKVK